MIIQIDPAGIVTLLDVDNLRHFSIRMAQTDAATASLAELARTDGPGHAWIAQDRILALVPQARPDWLSQFAAMTSYATGKGWTDATGAIRAHIEHT
jgi:hypothetical protein